MILIKIPSENKQVAINHKIQRVVIKSVNIINNLLKKMLTNKRDENVNDQNDVTTIKAYVCNRILYRRLSFPLHICLKTSFKKKRSVSEPW